MKNSVKFLILSASSGFISALIGTQIIGHPNSQWIPLVIFFGVLAGTLLLAAIVNGIDES